MVICFNVCKFVRFLKNRSYVGRKRASTCRDFLKFEVSEIELLLFPLSEILRLIALIPLK